MKQGTNPDPGAAPAARAPEGDPPRERGGDPSARRRRLAALVSLLADDSEAVRDEVRRGIEACGAEALPALERAANGDAPLVRGRARAILHDLGKRAAVRRLLRYASRGEVDLERALFLLGRFHAPGLDPRPYQRALDAMAAEVARRARGRTDELARAMALPEYLGKELGFGGGAGDFHHPDNVHVHRAIERRAGMPLTLSAIYLFVARRAGLRAALLPLPGHVMLRLYASWQSAIVDPYHHGRVRTEAECRKYLKQHGMPWRSASFRDADDAAMLCRQAGNLLRSSQMRGLAREARELSVLLRALEPRSRTAGARRT